jgi:hypothetical protein
MQPFSGLVKTTLPNYLQGLPIPDTIGGWFKLGGEKIYIFFFSIKLNFSFCIIITCGTYYLKLSYAKTCNFKHVHVFFQHKIVFGWLNIFIVMQQIRI